MRYLLVLFFVSILNLVFAQVESISPISRWASNKGKFPIEKSTTTFDSTFIYLTDTLGLPLIDDFSTNQFQTYNPIYNSPAVTTVKEYKLIDTNNVPYSHNSTFTTVQTFRRVVDLVNNTVKDYPFPAIKIKVGNQQSYPTVYATTYVYPAYYIYDTINVSTISDTIKIQTPDIVQDSAVQFFYKIKDATKIWYNNDVQQNFTFGINPWTIGVATFDGMNSFGAPYNLGGTQAAYNEYLTSKPIDLGAYAKSDSLYFSFLYQATGLGDAPEKTDSLILEFYDGTIQKWRNIWAINGRVDTTFTVVHIPIVDDNYFKNNFQFRFKKFASPAGGFDIFNIDYVKLRAFSSFDDTLFKDFALIYPTGSLLKTFTSVPWEHYQANNQDKMNNAVQIALRNNSDQPENNYLDAHVSVIKNNNLLHDYTVTGGALSNNALNYAPRTNYFSLHDFTAYHFDENTSGIEQTFDIITKVDAQFANLHSNDSVITHQYFGNYYSYDDGSAEVSYGVTGSQARLAQRYKVYQPDTLIGISACFVQSGKDVSDKLFQLTIWDENNSKPNNVLYQDNALSQRNPIYETGINQFHDYFFNNEEKVPVDSIFYIGWKQADADRLNIGFDRNLDNKNQLKFSVDNGATWHTSGINGTVMLRPIFSTALGKNLAVNENSMIQRIQIYPNPTSDLIYIQTENQSLGTVYVVNTLGEVMLSSTDKEIDLSNLKSGIYFIRFEDTSQLYKIIKL